MTRTDVGMKSTTSRRTSLRGLLALAVTLLLAVVPAAPAIAATANSEGLSGYKHEETAKQETQPSKEKAPAKTSSEPETTPSPSTTSSAPSTTTAAPKETKLPFTGFDLRWSMGFGLLLMGAGASIVLVQRRQRRGNGR